MSFEPSELILSIKSKVMNMMDIDFEDIVVKAENEELDDYVSFGDRGINR